jgi:hypothetical protein
MAARDHKAADRAEWVRRTGAGRVRQIRQIPISVDRSARRPVFLQRRSQGVLAAGRGELADQQRRGRVTELQRRGPDLLTLLAWLGALGLAGAARRITWLPHVDGRWVLALIVGLLVIAPYAPRGTEFRGAGEALSGI